MDQRLGRKHKEYLEARDSGKRHVFPRGCFMGVFMGGDKVCKFGCKIKGGREAY